MCGIPSGDQSIRRSLFEFAPAMSGQVIVLSSANLYQEMKTRPHWQLRLDEHSVRSTSPKHAATLYLAAGKFIVASQEWSQRQGQPYGSVLTESLPDLTGGLEIDREHQPAVLRRPIATSTPPSMSDPCQGAKIYNRHTQASAIAFIDYVIARFPFQTREV
jgi:hypothetical protein